MARQFDKISVERMKGVHPDLMLAMAVALQAAPFPFRIIDGVRTLARQRELVRIGASTTLRSRHLTGHAVDIVPLVDLDRDGKIETEEMFSWPLIRFLAPVVKKAAADAGVAIEWGGDWKSFPDGSHWQLSRKKYPG